MTVPLGIVGRERAMKTDDPSTGRDRWARLRFAIVGPLLAAPPRRGTLKALIEHLAEQRWKHPIMTDTDVGFSFSTIERWYYVARREQTDPVGVLGRPPRRDAGIKRRLSAKGQLALREQYEAHPSWSYQLHHDNLAVLVADDPTLGPRPSYATLRRFMRSHGMRPRRGKRPEILTAGQIQAAHRREALEIRSFEVEHVHGLWHLDFHDGSRKVLNRAGERFVPQLLGVLDDHSRLVCHLQWYDDETAEALVHGLSQAILKRGLPRALLTDNGSAMRAAEVEQGMQRLSIVYDNTLPYSAYQNAKLEVFWAQVEGRLMAMLEGEPELTLSRLNEATQAWVEMEYHREAHSEIHQSPLDRYLQAPNVGRLSPSSTELRQAFRAEVIRTQRKSDGTLSLQGRRFEIPSRFRHLNHLRIRYARWDLSQIDLIDPHAGTILCPLYPLDKAANADGRRRRLDPPPETLQTQPPPSGIAPLLKQLMADYAATGLPPAYLPRELSTNHPSSTPEPTEYPQS
jgi:transposase InsO family protein